MKKILVLAVMLIVLQIRLLAQEEMNLIGTYAHWEVSMCAQGCEKIDLGLYQLTKPLSIFKAKTMNKTVWVKGNFELVEEEPTVAGPNPDVELFGKKIMVKKVAVKEEGEIEFPKMKISDEEKEKCKNGEYFIINFGFTNPFDFDIDIKIKAGEEEFEEIKLKAKETKAIDCSLRINDFNCFDLLIVNKSFSPDNIKRGIKKAEKEKYMVYIKQTIEMVEIIK